MKTKEFHLSQMREAQAEIAAAETVEAREAAEKKYANAKREYEMLEMQERTNATGMKRTASALREFLREKKAGSTFELREGSTPATPFPGNATTDVAAAIGRHTVDVIEKSFDDKVIYTAAGCPVLRGAAGIADWIYAGGVSVKVVNELASIGDSQKLDLSKISAVQNRISAKVIISNQALENDSEVDLLQLTLRKINAAYAEAINFAATSTAKYGANFYGGFAHANKQTTTYASADGFTFKKAMEMVGMVAEKNYEAGYGCFVMGPADYYALKATPVDAGSGRMVIDEYGRLGGFPVFVSNAINRATVKGAVSGHNIGFGLFNYLPCLQHGAVRLSIDANSSDAADIDGVIVTCNADWSMTDLYADAFVVASKTASV